MDQGTVEHATNTEPKEPQAICNYSLQPQTIPVFPNLKMFFTRTTRHFIPKVALPYSRVIFRIDFREGTIQVNKKTSSRKRSGIRLLQ